MKITIIQDNRNKYDVPYQFEGHTFIRTIESLSHQSFKDEQERRKQTETEQYWTYILENEDLTE